MVELEDLINDLGGLGRYQILLTLCVMANLVPVGWSMLVMSFAGWVPDFYCIHNNTNTNGSGSISMDAMSSSALANFSVNLFINDSLNACEVDGATCSSYSYVTSAHNVISQWNLVCDKEWVKRAIISSQMAGVFVGAALSGQLGDVFGRKKVLYACQMEHVVINLVAAMSNSWIMFIVCRFFTGIPIGALLVIVLPYPVEFCPIKWRPITVLFPAFSIGNCIFALGTYLFPSWYHLHIACGALSLMSMFGIFFVPESIRWLATQNKIHEAQKVVEQIAHWNGKPVPLYSTLVLEQIAVEEEMVRENRGRYTYVDLFRTAYTAKISILFFFLNFSMSAAYFGVSFGVSSLSGSIHLNILLMAVLEIPTEMTTMYFLNTFGRRKSSVAFSGICVMNIGACMLAEYLVSVGHLQQQGSLVQIVFISARLMINFTWVILTAWGTELYPTVIRSLGFGFASTGSRVGGTVSPFLVNFDSAKFESYGTILALMALCAVAAVFLPETKGKALQDTVMLPRQQSDTREDDSAREEVMNDLRGLTEFSESNPARE